MKGLLGRSYKWANTTAKKITLFGGGILTLAVLGSAVSAPHAALAFTCTPTPSTTNNVPTCIRWLNRAWIVDSNGNNYTDVDTYDNVFDYVEQGTRNTGECQNHIDFINNAGSLLTGDGTNDALFYDVTHSDTGYGNPSKSDPSHSPWGIKVQRCTLTSSGGIRQQENLTDVTVNVDNNYDGTGVPARMVTFYINTDGTLINIPGGVTFTKKGQYPGPGGSDVYVRDDELADTSNLCPDIVVGHAAQPTGPGRTNLWGHNIDGARGDLKGSAVLYAVKDDTGIDHQAQTYAAILGLDPSINPLDNSNPVVNRCRPDGKLPNNRYGGIYGVFYHSTQSNDSWYESAGIDKNGNTSGGGDFGDDAFIIFVGTAANNWWTTPAGDPGTAPTPGSGTTGGTGSSGTKCEAGALGYLLCAIIDGINIAVQWFADVLQAFLVVNPLTIGSGPLYESWSNVRNLANVAFVLAFFAVIFSQATSIGISNYGIKRLLPRLILVAIATNLSYFICSFMVDAFNIMGSGVAGLFQLLGGTGVTINIGNATGGFFTGGLITVVGWAIQSGFILQLIPVIVAGFVGLLITFLALIMRQILIILLVVISPLAFVAALLPGTQSLFRRWTTMFTGLLVLYPAVVAIFAATQLAQYVLQANVNLH